MMQYKCTICGATFDGDAMMHVGFGHGLIRIITETENEAGQNGKAV